MTHARTIAASYEDMDAARKAFMTLERAGIDAGRITMRGEQIDRAEERLDKRAEESRATGFVFRRALIGAAAGAVLGALLGFAAGVAYDAVGSGPLVTTPVWVAAGFVMIGTGAAGGVFGGVTGLGIGKQWELTFEPVAQTGRVVVEVSSDDTTEIQKARAALMRTTATSIMDDGEVHGAAS
ncbi:MAG: hypothetical protein ABR552_06420 [Actinomycetota bacterium]